MLENVIEKYLIDQCFVLGWECLKLGTGRWPDRVVVPENKPAAFLELKRPNHEPTGLQLHRIKTLADLGHVAGWANSEKMVSEFLGRVADQPNFRPVKGRFE